MFSITHRSFRLIVRSWLTSCFASASCRVSRRISDFDFMVRRNPIPSDKPIKPPATKAPIIQTETGCAGKAQFPNVITMGVELKNENVMLATNTSIRKNPDRSWAMAGSTT